MDETKEPEIKEEAPSPTSKASFDSSAVTDKDVATWKASFANSNPEREKGALDKPDFVALVLKVVYIFFKPRQLLFDLLFGRHSICFSRVMQPNDVQSSAFHITFHNLPTPSLTVLTHPGC
jgi:hypothetical protein